MAAVCAALLAALGLACVQAVLDGLPNLNLRKPVAMSEPGEGAGAAPTPPRRVLLIVVDGLRADVAEGLPFLRSLAEKGARLDVTAESPSYSSPQYVALLTGVPARDSGVRTNTAFRQTPLDNVVRRLRAAGRSATQVGDEVDWWGRLFADFTLTRLVAPGALMAAAEEDMPRADLALVHITGVDQAGHQRGAGSTDYQSAAVKADGQVRWLASTWVAMCGADRAAVVVMADHGHVEKGGHGGEEPEVMRAWLIAAGAGVRAGARVSGARMIDVAPTLAALLGVPAPADAQGRTVVEALDVDAAAAGALAAADARRIGRTTRAAAAGRRALRDADTWRRLGRGAALLVCAAALVIALRRAGRRAWLGVLAGFGALLVTAAVWAVWYERLSFSADRDTSRLVVGTAMLAIGGTLLIFLPAWWVALRGRLSPATASALSMGAVLGASPLAALAFVHVGAFQQRVDCDPGWLATLPVLAYCAFAPVAFAAALLVATATTRDLFAELAARFRRSPRE